MALKSSMLEQKSFTYATLLDPRHKKSFLKHSNMVKNNFTDDLVVADQGMQSTDSSSTDEVHLQDHGRKA